ncbi:MAG: hypothetical protein AAGE52_24675 [Myxococcota bacterium]
MKTLLSIVLGLGACGGSTAQQSAAESNPATEEGAAVERTEASNETPGGLRLLDFVVMRDGYGPEDRARYTTQVQRIARDHGVTLEQSYRVEQAMNGEVQPVLDFNIWQVPAPEALGALGEDPRYQALVEMRDRIHDMTKLTLYLAEPTVSGDQLTSNHVLVDLVFLNEGKTLEDRAAYGRLIGPIAQRHGLRRVQSYRVLQHLGGLGNGAVELNLWEVDDPSALQATLTDPEYQSHVPTRNEIHDMERLTMLLARPNPGGTR